MEEIRECVECGGRSDDECTDEIQSCVRCARDVCDSCSRNTYNLATGDMTGDRACPDCLLKMPVYTGDGGQER